MNDITLFFGALVANVDFYGPQLKVERAEHHIHALEAIARDYLRRNAQRMRPKRNRLVSRKEPATFPRHTSTTLGDAIHNLRVALDHAYHIVAEKNGATFNPYRRFPFGGDKESLKGSLNGYQKQGTTPSNKVIRAILDEIQPYPSGALNLYGLHQLDITDKHLVLIPTSAFLGGGITIELLDASGLPSGRKVTIDGHLGMPEPGKGQEFFNFGPHGAVCRGDLREALKICFGDGQPFEGKEVVSTVRKLHASVLRALSILQDAAN
ncbi:hypothetical protein [Aurantiacibacter sp. D1-12]|uniref:hypothetical protein n=1 Tax=Aurantiacibacter sp. D1-12 TaxID=2993658 RepID=UPI00237C7FCB|nr:hypothetical protein [Aurantiacibacter sp. D1-12]MDE1466322.1 hypothetical protein [Aurantiacibacter sp. D1-12]